MNLREMCEELLSKIDAIENSLELAIEENNWAYVADAYKILSGQSIEIPHNESDNTLKSVMARLEKLENKGGDQTTVKKPKKGRASKEKVSSNNKFDSMTDLLADAAKENGFDQINDKIQPSERNRPRFSYKNVTCRECNRSMDVHPMFAKENYICDKCVGRMGGR